MLSCRLPEPLSQRVRRLLRLPEPDYHPLAPGRPDRESVTAERPHLHRGALDPRVDYGFLTSGRADLVRERNSRAARSAPVKLATTDSPARRRSPYPRNRLHATTAPQTTTASASKTRLKNPSPGSGRPASTQSAPGITTTRTSAPSPSISFLMITRYRPRPASVCEIAHLRHKTTGGLRPSGAVSAGPKGPAAPLSYGSGSRSGMAEQPSPLRAILRGAMSENLRASQEESFCVREAPR